MDAHAYTTGNEECYLHATVLCSCSVLPKEIVSAKVQKPGRDGTRKKTTSTFLRNDCGKEGQGDCPISAVFPPSFCSSVAFLCVFISSLFLHFLQVHPYLAETSSPVSVVLGVSKATSK